MPLDTLTILYTYGLRGDLQALPTLYTFLQTLKQQHGANCLLLDLGASCDEQAWHCNVTNGRSTLIVLDGMGYHAANISDFLADGERDKLKTIISTGMVDARHAWRYHVPPIRDEGIIIVGEPAPALTLCIVAAPAKETKLDNRTLFLKAVEVNEVGVAQIDLTGMMSLIDNKVLSVPKGLKPDPTIVAAIEFVEDEARYFQQQQDKHS